MKISFDFDCTLSEPKFQITAKNFIDKGHDVWIVTSRVSQAKILTWNDDLFKIAEKLNIPKEKIVFTEGDAKYKYLEEFDLHFDDDQVEIDDISLHCYRCIGILIDEPLYFNL